jgi:hypothetical protein
MFHSVRGFAPVVLLSFCLTACGILAEKREQEISAQYDAASNACGQIQAGPVPWAQCQTNAENQYLRPQIPPSYTDLLNLKQARRAEIVSRLQRGQITIEQADVELATMTSQLVSEMTSRRMAAQSVAAQQSVAASAAMSAVQL